MLIGADAAELARWDVVVRPYDPRKKGRGGLLILLAAGLLAFIFVVSHYLDSDGSAATIITTVTVPPITPADPTADAGTDYGRAHADSLCSTLAEYPSFDGIMATAAEAMQGGGLSAYQGAEALGVAVDTSCPKYLPLLTRFMNRGSTTLT
jgi:hypothetical protein